MEDLPRHCNNRSHKIKIIFVFAIGVMILYLPGNKGQREAELEDEDRIRKALWKMCG